MAPSHRTAQATSTLHSSSHQTSSAIPGRQGRAPPRRPRITAAPRVLPSPIFYWRSQHLAGPRAFRTSTTPHRIQHPRPPFCHHPPHPARSLQMGLPPTLHHTYGVVHLKAKKQWQKGRTIISYFQSLSGNLLRITSRALDIVLQHIFPQHPGQLSIPQLWHHFHSYLTQTPTDVNLHATNDDLVGFFNSVPQHRLIDAVHSLIQQWQSQQATHTLTVDTKATGNPFHRSHVGRRYIKHPTQRTIHTSDITTIVAIALNTCIFRAYKQIRGAGPNSLPPYATLPSPSSSILGTNSMTTSSSTPPFTSHSTDTWTTDS